MKIFNNLYDKIVENVQKKEKGEVTSISPPFPRLSKRYPGWVKGTYTIVTASSGVGKTKITKYFAVISVYNFIKQNPTVKAKVFYFALEESKEMFWLSMISTLLSVNYDMEISPQQLLSLGEYNLTPDQLKCIKTVEEEVNDMEKYIDVIDHIFNPFGIYKYVRDWFYTSNVGKFNMIKTDDGEIPGEFVYYDDNTYVFGITDHISLLTPDTNGTYNKQSSLHEAMGSFSQDYCLKQFTKRFKMVTINVQQQSAEKEKQEFFRGQSIEKKLEPSLDGLADNKLCQRDKIYNIM